MTPFSPHPSLKLLPEGAAFLTNIATLVVADLHLGKSAAFRAKGLPVPEGDTARDLGRMRALVEKHAAACLVIAGDLFHAPSGITPELHEAMDAFLDAIGIPVTLVLGNHDVKIRGIPPRLHPVKRLDLAEGLAVVHDPADATGDSLHLCGHLHPIVKIPDGRRTSLRFPCFLMRGNTLALPSFGSFTGGAVMHPKPEDRVFVALRDQIIELPGNLV
ncbi:MAG: ligase-associated DNA damage response endonuclease PdeM [Verrucomicrobiota bacterium]